MSRNLRLACLCFALTTLASCANTQLVNIWTDPSLKATKFTNMLALVISKDEVARRIGEDTLVRPSPRPMRSARTEFCRMPNSGTRIAPRRP